jgi:hypothetical protein
LRENLQICLKAQNKHVGSEFYKWKKEGELPPIVLDQQKRQQERLLRDASSNPTNESSESEPGDGRIAPSE